LHWESMTENHLGRNHPSTETVDQGRPATQLSGFASRFNR
jgi:hypothetical protein